MKAFFATAYGGPEVMKLGDLPDLVPRAGEVLVAVRAASVNPVDWKVRRGEMRGLSGKPPKILGTDFAGTVAALGAGVSGLAVGAAVYGTTRMMLRAQGSHAERVAVPAKRLAPVPAGLSFEEAAALPVAGLTALNGLRRCGELRGKVVAVVGATGGVGHLAVQIAKARGARVTAVCSGRNAGRALVLGADEVVDYRQEDFTRGGRRWDVVFDAHGGLGFQAAARVLSDRGVYATTLAGPAAVLRHLWQRLAGGKQLALANLRDRPEDYAELAQLVASGAVKPVVGRVFPLEQAAEAFAAQEGGGTVGKVVIRVG
ncbi:MAG TPA: NAD(P)-dependent alcohol dehydrogenase [Anaeromyxobacteraceae bacterium]